MFYPLSIQVRTAAIKTISFPSIIDIHFSQWKSLLLHKGCSILEKRCIAPKIAKRNSL